MRNFIIEIDIQSVIKEVPEEIKDTIEYIVENAQNRGRDQKRYFEAINDLDDYLWSAAVRTVVVWAMGPYIEKEVTRFVLYNFNVGKSQLQEIKEVIIKDMIFTWLLEKIKDFDAGYTKKGYTGARMYLVTYIKKLLRKRIWGHLYHLVKTKKLNFDVEAQTEIYTGEGEQVDSLHYLSEALAYQEYVEEDVYMIETSSGYESIQQIFKIRRQELGVK